VVGLAAVLFVIAALFGAIDMAIIHQDYSGMTWSNTTKVSQPPASKSIPVPTTLPTAGPTP
jgi:hypothetical protein